jgi:hypothetical protein
VDLFLAISQGTGLALACGFRPYLPPLLAGALASADAGIDYSGTDFAFLEDAGFLIGMVALTATAIFIGRRTPAPIIVRSFALTAIALGALEFGGSLAEEGYAGGPGLIAGAFVAFVGCLAAAALFEGARARLAARGEDASAGLVLLYGDAAALLMTVAAVFVGPISYLPLAFCLWLIAGRRRRAARKYEGLRVLR